ncbi:hypothetical protein BH20ACT11_BH20ACT11_04860 [soil metagenome]
MQFNLVLNHASMGRYLVTQRLVLTVLGLGVAEALGV